MELGFLVNHFDEVGVDVCYEIHPGEDLHDGIQEMLDADEPFLLEVIVPHTEHVLPMIPQGKSAKEMLID